MKTLNMYLSKPDGDPELFHRVELDDFNIFNMLISLEEEGVILEGHPLGKLNLKSFNKITITLD